MHHQDDILIRQATLNDLGPVAALFDAYRVFYRQPSDLPGAQRFLQGHLTAGTSMILLALDRGGAGLGFTQLFASWSSVSMRRLWILNDLFVTPAARRRGVARRLMAAAREHAVATGSKGLVLETAQDNHAAQRLYESLGYIREQGFYTYSLAV